MCYQALSAPEVLPLHQSILYTLIHGHVLL
jgi:hypothetical protein